MTVPRPRVHDEDALLDAAEALLAEDPEALTIRALAQRTGAPSGTLYHAFGSRPGLLARLWLRAARAFLTRQGEAIDATLGGTGRPGREQAVDAVVAASLTLADLRRERPGALLVLAAPQPDPDALPAGLRAEVAQLEADLLDHLKRLARALSGRADRRTVGLVTVCVVDLPTALLVRRPDRGVAPEPLLAAAVRGVLAAS